MNASASWSVLPIRPIRKLLVADRGEIAIRVMRAAAELGIRTVALYTEEDCLSPHRCRADESCLVGEGRKPGADSDIGSIIAIALAHGADAIHPGDGFLSRNPDFAEACAANGIAFIGPAPTLMRTLGNRMAARAAAIQAGLPVLPATGALPADIENVRRMAADIGYPVMLKASRGAGGRGVRRVDTEAELPGLLAEARGEAAALFGNDEMVLEKLIRRARHLEVQVLGDLYGNRVHLFERESPVRRRNQTALGRAPAPVVDEAGRAALYGAALRLAEKLDYTHAGTVEFLVEVDTGAFYFIGVNPRIEAGHLVTGQATGIDMVKAQIRISEGARVGGDEPSAGVPAQGDIHLNRHALNNQGKVTPACMTPTLLEEQNLNHLLFVRREYACE